MTDEIQCRKKGDTKANATVGDAPRARSIKDGPWVWASKSALQRLIESTGETADVACRARSTYLALCELASDAASESFSATKALIAFRAGLSIRTVQRVLPDLERAGVLLIARSAAGLRTASTYTLLFVPSGHGDSTSGHNGSTIGHGTGRGQVADRVEERERKEPRTLKERLEAKASSMPPSAGEVEDYSKAIGWPLNGEQFIDTYLARGWKDRRGRPITDWRRQVRLWKRHRLDGYGGAVVQDGEQASAPAGPADQGDRQS